ncbi:MAG TPA: HNH endonuclease signature motif containing protein [Blastocatellia bacterium]|nr:HNH endonuclease signature motif containing protein [Blastocatellia bacterium]
MPTSEKYIPSDLRQLVRTRAKGVCEYCRSQEYFSPQPFSIEHIKPRALGGQSIAENLAFSCQGCNGHKYIKEQAIDPLTGNTVLLYNPRTQQWRAHFAWNANATLIVGLTPIGRATVEVLRLNRPELINLRSVLYAAQKHPPSELGAE